MFSLEGVPEVKNFSLVFLYAKPINHFNINDIKEKLKLPEKEKFALLELNDNVGTLLLEEQNKKIVIEGRRISFDDSGVRDNNLENIMPLLNPNIGLINGMPIKAFGINFDLLIKLNKKWNTQDFFSKLVNDAIADYETSQIGVQLAFHKNGKKNIVEINSIKDKETELMVHFNNHNEANLAPSSKDLLNIANEDLAFLLEFMELKSS